MTRKEFNVQTGEITIHPALAQEELPASINKSLDDLKKEKWELVKKIRSHYEYGGVFVSGKWFHTDSKSRLKYSDMELDARLAINDGEQPTDFFKIMDHNYPWTTMDNSNVILTNQLVINIAQAIKLLDVLIYPHSQILRAQINNTITKNQLAQIDIFSGWPQTYVMLDPLTFSLTT